MKVGSRVTRPSDESRVLCGFVGWAKETVSQPPATKQSNSLSPGGRGATCQGTRKLWTAAGLFALHPTPPGGPASCWTRPLAGSPSPGTKVTKSVRDRCTVKEESEPSPQEVRNIVEDLEAARLALETASAADGGCLPCVQGCVDEAVCQHPELPWKQAVSLINPMSTRRVLAEAVRSALGMVKT